MASRFFYHNFEGEEEEISREEWIRIKQSNNYYVGLEVYARVCEQYEKKMKEMEKLKKEIQKLQIMVECRPGYGREFLKVQAITNLPTSRSRAHTL